jgi:putative NADPH-quinone reductase
MKKVTIIFAHPFIKDSVANKEIISYIKKVRASYDIRNLYEIYPDFNIDVKKEQEQLIHFGCYRAPIPLLLV